MAKRGDDETQTIPVGPFRMSRQLVSDLDTVVEELVRERPGVTVTRSDAIRLLLQSGLGQWRRAKKRRRKP
jgi:hypothetical protein